MLARTSCALQGRDALTPTHYDGHHNIFMQFAGAKRWLLFDADQTPNLYGFPAYQCAGALVHACLR